MKKLSIIAIMCPKILGVVLMIQTADSAVNVV